MKLTILSLLLAVLFALPANARGQQNTRLANGSAPDLYGNVIYSEAGLSKGVYSFPAQANTTLTRVYGDSNFNINGPAVRWNGNYYMVKGEDYGEGVTEVTVFVYDSDWEEIDELSFQANWYGTDLTVDPTTNIIYGVFASYSGDPELATINFDNGQRTAIGTLQQSIIALAADATGLLYGIGTNGVLYRISKTDAQLTQIGRTGVTPQYMQSATFDLATNRLFWATTVQEEGCLYEVDTQTGSATLVSVFPGNEELVGLYSLSEASPWEGGPDTPTAPTDVLLTYADGTVTLTWQAPAEGIHGEPLDADALTYTVTRYPGAVIVADGISQTTFTEQYAPEELTAFYYTVVAHNGELTGDAAQSNIASAGDAITPPYRQLFDDPATTALLTTIDGDGDGSTWLFQEGAAFLWGAPFENTNDYLVSPALKLDAQYTYRLRVQTWCEWAGNYPYTITAYVGQGATRQALSQQIFTRQRISDNGLQQFDELFSVPASGNYNIGIRANGYDLSSIYLDNLIVEQGPKTTAPKAVTDLTAQPDAQGGAKVTLSFTAPTQTLSGATLSSIEKAVIYRDGTLIGEISSVTPGQLLTYTDNEAKLNQQNNYSVAVVSTEGEGQQAEIMVWVGFDAPTQPIDVVLKEVAGKAVLTWQAPQVGQNGGVVDAQSLYYGVVRSDDEVVAYNLQATTFQEDIDQTGEQRWLLYGVQAANALGYSQIAQSNAIIAGAPYELPFYEGFPNGSRTNFWGAEDYNSQGWGSSWGGYTEDVDGNGGCIAFGTSGGYENSGSHLFSGKINIKGADTPILEYYYSHRSESYDGLGTPLHVYIVKNGTDTVKVKDIEPIYFWQIDTSNPFTYDRIALDEFKDADFIQVLFDVVNAGTTYTYIDAVGVRNLVDNDLSIALSAPATATSGNELTATATVKNVGSLQAEAYSVSLYDGERLIATQQSAEALAADGTQAFTFSVPVTTLAESMQLQAIVSYEADQATANNQSDVVIVTVTLPIYPIPENAIATQNENEVTLTWTTPDYASFAVPTVDDVESYEPYVVTTFGQWTTVDRDGLPTHDDIYADSEHVVYDAAGQPTSWLVFNPIVRNYPTTSWFGDSNGWQPVSGEQFFVAVAAANGTSDDWLISPELTGDAQTISFYEHGYYNMETFEVLYSTTDTNPDSFTLLSSETSSYDWTQRSYQLPAGARYFAIRHTTSYGYRLFVDDISFQSNDGKGALQLAGYSIYRDGQFIGTTDADVTTFNDANASKGDHKYQVTARYNLGESAAASAFVTITTDIVPRYATHETTEVYSLDGRRQQGLQRGINIVRGANGKSRKVVVK